MGVMALCALSACLPLAMLQCAVSVVDLGTEVVQCHVPGVGDDVLKGGLEGAGLSDDEDDGGALPLSMLHACCPAVIRLAVRGMPSSVATPVCLVNTG
jgi:hypothetical protein